MNNKPKETAEADNQLEQELRQGRKFNSAEAIARLAGPGAMKGASPVSRVQQAETEIGLWLGSNLIDEDCGLKPVLHRQLRGSPLLLENLDQPLAALTLHCQRLIRTEDLLKELVREADVEWGRAMDERPHFQREGTPSHPHDPYTSESVRVALKGMLELLQLSRAFDRSERPIPRRSPL